MKQAFAATTPYIDGDLRMLEALAYKLADIVDGRGRERAIADAVFSVQELRASGAEGVIHSLQPSSQLDLNQAWSLVAEAVGAATALAEQCSVLGPLGVSCEGSGQIWSAIRLVGSHFLPCADEVPAQLRALGVRVIAPADIGPESWCDASSEFPQHSGWSTVALSILPRLNEQQIILDISGMSRTAAEQCLEYSAGPVLVGGVGARAIADTPGNLSDQFARRIAERGGVILVGFNSDRLIPERSHSLRDSYVGASHVGSSILGDVGTVADHVVHFSSVVGPSHVALSSGFGAGLMPIPGLSGPLDMPALFSELERRGLSRLELDAIARGNLKRVLRM